MVAPAWEFVRHQAAVAGVVTDKQTGKPIAGASIECTNLVLKIKKWTRTSVDGHYYFMDLPNGDFTIDASRPQSGSRYSTAQVVASVTRTEEGRINLAIANLALPSTTITGHITGPDADDVVIDNLMAEVKLKGSEDRCFSNNLGVYLLSGIETGKRTLLVKAQGYVPVNQTVAVNTAGALVTQDILLVKAT
jgi:hypothetical protein